MSFSTDWDIEKYHVGYESEEHWDLRKQFLLKHKEKYPEDKLVCLAQVFYNVEFLGCRYPQETMNMVEKLSEGIVESHREKMKGRLKRTFVAASDAASTKVKGLKRSVVAAELDKQCSSSSTGFSSPTILCTKPKLPKSIQFEPSNQDIPVGIDEPVAPSKKKKKKKKNKQGSSCDPPNKDEGCSNSTNFTQPTSSVPVVNPISKHPSFQDMILYYREDDVPRLRLKSSADFCRIPLEMSTEVLQRPTMKCSVKIRGVEVGTGSGLSAALAQDAAASCALEFLSKQCYTILIKSLYVVGRKVSRQEIIDGVPDESDQTQTVTDDKASRMMKMMGWSGGGLGKMEQGRTQPVLPVHQTRRAGMGANVGNLKFNKLKKILTDFVKQGSLDDLVFSPDFEISERKEIHMVAQRLGLKSVSRAKGKDRFLVVSKKWTPQMLKSILMDPKNETEKYKLIPPNPIGTV